MTSRREFLASLFLLPAAGQALVLDLAPEVSPSTWSNAYTASPITADMILEAIDALETRESPPGLRFSFEQLPPSLRHPLRFSPIPYLPPEVVKVVEFVEVVRSSGSVRHPRKGDTG